MNHYKLAERAEEDLTEIYAYGLRRWGEDSADSYYHALLERFQRIAARPYLYQPVDFICEGYRRSVCGEHSIYYRMEKGTVEIMAILRSQDADTAL